MKKLSLYAMLLLVSLSSVSSPLHAAEKNPTTITSTSKDAKAEVDKLVTRLETIRAMDKSTLDRSEKRVLRKEVRAIKSELKDKRHGVYVSVGAFIIIILLLVILL
jgi:Skp family chaperone for outer membrane proteins